MLIGNAPDEDRDSARVITREVGIFFYEAMSCFFCTNLHKMGKEKFWEALGFLRRVCDAEKMDDITIDGADAHIMRKERGCRAGTEARARC